MLFCRTLNAKLVDMGFEINSYDRCVANKLIDGKQCTILWVSQCNAQVVTGVVNEHHEEYCKDAPLNVSIGKNMIIWARWLITRAPSTKSCLLQGLPSNMEGMSATPAPLHLFAMNESARVLDEGTAQFFHHNVAKLPFLCKRPHPDIQTAVAFLYTRMKCSVVDEYKKLTRVMRYLCNTENLSQALRLRT